MSSSQPIPSTSTSSSSSATTAAAPTNTSATTSEPYYDTTSHKWMVESSDGTELEWDTIRNSWQPVVDDALLKKQQAAYAVQGVDENEETTPLTKEERKAQQKLLKKRKATGGDPSGDSTSTDGPSASKKSRANTAVYLTNLPESTTVETISSVFSKAGLILEDVSTGQPRIKLYTDPETGKFKREALVVYLQPASVELAVRLFDQTELELGSGQGLITVQEAKWDESKKKEKKKEATDEDEEKKKQEQRAKKQGKKAAALRQKLEDWSSEDESTKPASKKLKGVVVLEGMFTLKELDEDATLLLDLKEDVRDECETLGQVTNVTLYDKEEKGIMTVRFKDDISAQACILKMAGRFFAGRTIQAYPMDSSHKFRKSGRGDGDFDDETSATTTGSTGAAGTNEESGTVEGEGRMTAEEKEKERLKAYAEWLEKGGE